MKIQNCLNSVLILSFRYPVTLMSRFPKISKFGQKVLNLGLFFGIFDEILPKFIRLMFQSSLEDKEKVQTLTISTVSTVLSSMNLAGRRLLMFQRSWHQFRKNFFGFSFCPSFHDQRMALEKNELTRKYVTGGILSKLKKFLEDVKYTWRHMHEILNKLKIQREIEFEAKKWAYSEFWHVIDISTRK